MPPAPNPRPKKALGQHFLADKELLDRICGAAGSLERVLEVGAGGGSLTAALLANGAEQLVALEKDERCMPLLRKLAAAHPQRLKVIQTDARHFPLSQSGLAARFRVVGNLPYHIAANLILGWLDQARAVSSFCLLLQKEVAVRLAAEVGDISGLSVTVQRVLRPELLFEIPAEHFSPPPKVTSALILLTPHEKPYAAAAVAELDVLLRTAFNQRRKMLANSLKNLPEGLAALERQGVNLKSRPEEIAGKFWYQAAEAMTAKE